MQTNSQKSYRRMQSDPAYLALLIEQYEAAADKIDRPNLAILKRLIQRELNIHTGGESEQES